MQSQQLPCQANQAEEYNPSQKTKEFLFLNFAMCHLLLTDLHEGQQWAQVFPCQLQGPLGSKKELDGQ